MELLAVFFQILITNPLTVILVIFGVLSVALAIIGKIPPIELAEDRARKLTRFGVSLISSGVILAFLLALLAWLSRPATVASTATPLTQTETSAPPTATPTPTSTATSTLALTLTPTPTDIVPTDRVSGWFIVKDDKGSSISIAVVPARTDDGLEISYDLKKDGWVIISRNISPDILSGIKAIRFFHKGSGAPNTIEFKLVYARGTVFSVLLPGATVTDDWVLEEIQYIDFRCWTTTPDYPTGNELVEPEKVTKIEFAIADKPGLSDEPGSGKVIIDDVQGIQP